MKTAIAAALVMLLAGAHPVVAQEHAQVKESEPQPGEFLDPPDGYGPHTWWHWINGHVTEEGITADLEAMKKVGIEGATLFNIGLLRTIPGSVDFMSPEWWSLVDHAMREAARLDLDLGVHNSDGWSQSGGPWVTPEESMKQVVWTETEVEGPGRLSRELPRPDAVEGFYRDIAVLAFPSTDTSERALTIAAPGIDGASLTDGDLKTIASIPADGHSADPYNIDLTYEQPRTLRSMTLMLHRVYRRISVSPDDVEIQVSTDGRRYRPLATVPTRFKFPRPTSITVSFEPATGRYFRIAFAKVPHIELSEIVPGEAPRVPLWESKAGYIQYPSYGDETELYANTPVPAESLPADYVISKASVHDLIGQMDGDRLSWSVPPGRWTLLRVGYTSTGSTNNPATSQGAGLEVDKLSRIGLKKHFAAMVGELVDHSRQVDSSPVKYTLLDSWEAETQNWTDGFQQEFNTRRGYDLTPYLPVLAGGRVVDSYDVSERFLWDLRLTIAELMAENYWGYAQELAAQQGIQIMGEASGPSQFLTDPLMYHRQMDVPMGEFWVPDGTERFDNRDAASAAHVNGTTLVAAEAFTGRNAGWNLDPSAMKAAGDEAFTRGINWFILHSFVHQPYDVQPGFTLGKFGNQFQRNNTWFLKSRSWIDYLKRSQYMLRQGRFVADIAYFTGEGVPSRIGFREDINPPIPKGYDYDGLDAKAVQSLAVLDGRLVLPSGMSYRLLVLPDQPAMTPEFAEQIRRLVRDGATVVARKPEHSPSLSGYPDSDELLRQIADEVWGSVDGHHVTEHAFGSGRVIWGPALRDVLTSIGAGSDFTCEASPDAEINYIHRRTSKAEIYFVANASNHAEEARCTFRTRGKIPELWHPDTGRIEKLAEYRPLENGTMVPLHLEPAGSVFVVFRESQSISDPVVSVTHDGAHADRSDYSLRETDEGRLELVTREEGDFELEHASGRKSSMTVDSAHHSFGIDGPWSVRFESRTGPTDAVYFDRLVDWSRHDDQRIRYFSGTATYSTYFSLPQTYDSADVALFLDLGAVKNLATVRLNGRTLRTLWKKPFRLEITDAVTPGRNELEVDVTNLWINRMVGDEHLPQDVEYRADGAIMALPTWLTDGKPRSSGRSTFVTWRQVSRDDELLPSGLLGPVVIEAAERRIISRAAPSDLDADDSRPNILFLFLDDWGRYAGAYADPDEPSPNDLLQTPNMDRLAQEGVLFSNAFMGVPSCAPSRASVSTGAYFWRAGRRANLRGGDWEGVHDPGDDLTGVGTVLEDAGYHVGRVFKTFDSRWVPGPRYGGTKMSARYSLLASKYGLDEARRQIEDEIRSRFRDFLSDRRPDQPFFLAFGPTNAHRPWAQGSGNAYWNINPDDLKGRLPSFLPDVDIVREDFADYLGEVQALDAYLGFLLDELTRTGELDQTMIVLTGDNGPPGFPRGKGNLYDFGSAAPLIIRWEDGIPNAGRTVDDFVNLMDLAPTFLEAAGSDPPPTMDGRSLMTQLLASRGGLIDPSRDFVVMGRERHVPEAREGNLPYPSRAIRTKDFLYIRNFKPERLPMGHPPKEGEEPSFEELKTDHYAAYTDLDAGPTKAWMVMHRDDPQIERQFELGFGKRPAEELYDLSADPDQVENVAADPAYASVKHALSDRLLKVLRDTNDPRLHDAFDRPPYVEKSAVEKH